MTDYLHQVAFLRKPLLVGKPQLKDAYLNKRELSNEPINVLINGKKVRHALYQSPAKACFNTVFNCKMDSRHLLWGSPSECYNRMFAGEISEGASPISFRNKLLPCVNPFFTEAEETKWREGCRDGRFHPKYWGVDWGFRQWFDDDVKKKKEGRIIEDEVKAQMHAEGFEVFNNSTSNSGTGPDAKRAKSAAVVKSPATIASSSLSATASSSKPSLPQQSEAADVPPVKVQITPEEYVAQTLAASRTLGAKEHANHEAQVRAKASALARDNWLPVPLTHIALHGPPQGNSQSSVPELVLTNPCGQPFELVERPDRLCHSETKQEAKEREDKQKKLYYSFEHWDLFCKRKEEYFKGRGDIHDKESEMMRLFRIEETNADNARKWWAREKRIRDETWKPSPEASANQAMETRYTQLFGRIEKRKRAEQATQEQTKKQKVARDNRSMLIGKLAELLARRMIVERGDGTLCAKKNITFSDRIETILLDRHMCGVLRGMVSGRYEKFTAKGLRNEELRKAKGSLAAGSKKSAPAKRLDWEK